MNRNCKSYRNVSDEKLSERSTRNLTKWVTKKPMISDVEYLTPSTTNHNKEQYRWCNYCNDGNGAYGDHWKAGHKEWREKLVDTNKIIKGPNLDFDKFFQFIGIWLLMTSNHGNPGGEL